MRSVTALVILFICLFLPRAYAQNHSATDSLLSRLNAVIVMKSHYVARKQSRINALSARLNKLNPPQQNYRLYDALYEEYKSYRYDSSYLYAKKLLAVAVVLKNPAIFARARMKLAFTLLSSGLFKETLEELNLIETGQLTAEDKHEYYYLKARTYFDLADYNRNPDYTAIYNPLGIQCIDSALAEGKPGSKSYLELKGLKDLRTGNFKDGMQTYNALMKTSNLSAHQFAVNACCLSYIDETQGRQIESEELLIKAAISDIESATKETVASYKLADKLYKRGDIDHAYIYIKQAMDDATFYGALHRQVKISSILPIIEAQWISQIEHQKRVLTTYAFIITGLILFVIAFAWIIFMQLKKLRIADNLILEANQTLQVNNRTLGELNGHLSTANKIKNEYIGYYFNINSVYLDKLESIKKSLDKKLTSKRYDDALTAVNNINLENERKVLFDTFDKVFLRLFPDFVSSFNSFFLPDQVIAVPEGQLLGTEHRIFALIRMGIHDNDRIAKLLGYSVNTIYSYKNRIKNKSFISNDEFEEHIMLIEAV